jgi:hypothetical protein
MQGYSCNYMYMQDGLITILTGKKKNTEASFILDIIKYTSFISTQIITINLRLKWTSLCVHQIYNFCSNCPIETNKQRPGQLPGLCKHPTPVIFFNFYLNLVYLIPSEVVPARRGIFFLCFFVLTLALTLWILTLCNVHVPWHYNKKYFKISAFSQSKAKLPYNM